MNYRFNIAECENISIHLAKQLKALGVNGYTCTNTSFFKVQSIEKKILNLEIWERVWIPTLTLIFCDPGQFTSLSWTTYLICKNKGDYFYFDSCCEN